MVTVKETYFNVVAHVKSDPTVSWGTLYKLFGSHYKHKYSFRNSLRHYWKKNSLPVIVAVSFGGRKRCSSDKVELVYHSVVRYVKQHPDVSWVEVFVEVANDYASCKTMGISLQSWARKWGYPCVPVKQKITGSERKKSKQVRERIDETHPKSNVCASPGCGIRLSSFNNSDFCYVCNRKKKFEEAEKYWKKHGI